MATAAWDFRQGIWDIYIAGLDRGGRKGWYDLIGIGFWICVSLAIPLTFVMWRSVWSPMNGICFETYMNYEVA